MKKIVLFKSPTCGPCKLFAPMVKQAVKELNIEYQEVDVSTDERSKVC